jgi:hypothetical protein
MDEYAEIYFLDDEDDDFRNATRDHRTSSGRVMVPSRRPGGRVRVARPVARPTSRTVVARPVVMAQEQQQGSILGNLTRAELVELGAKVLASIQPLPPAPLATGKTDDDIANLITYQSALSLHAKRDEQLRTIGDLLAKVLS